MVRSYNADMDRYRIINLFFKQSFDPENGVAIPSPQFLVMCDAYLDD